MPSTSSINQNKHSNLSRRLLFPHLAQDEPLPSLTISGSSGTCQQLSTLDTELYDIIALSLRAFVLPWWSKISKNDKEFCSQICRVISHVTREVESRLSNTDCVVFFFHEITTIFTQHYVDFRFASSKTSTSYSAGGALTFPQTFHALQAHMAIKSDGSVDETYLRLAIEQVLDTCLPDEDSDSEMERSIVREIVVNSLQENLFGRIPQPWFWMKLLLDELGPPRTENVDTSAEKYSKGITFHTFIVMFLSMVQTLSTLALALVTFTSSFYHLIVHSHPKNGFDDKQSRQALSTRPLIDFVAHAFTLRDRHTSSAILSTVEGLEAVAAPIIRRLICSQADKIDTDTIAKLVRHIKFIMFPNNGYPDPRPAEPTVEEQAEIRESLERRLVELGASFLPSLIVGQGVPTRCCTVHNLVEPLSNGAANSHLILFLFDALLLSLFPEAGLTPDGLETLHTKR